MTKKQIAAIVAAVLGLLGTLGAAVSARSTAGSATERIRVLEVREDLRSQADAEDARWRERIELKIDRLIERGR